MEVNMAMSMRDLIPWGRNRNLPAPTTGDNANPFLALHREMNRIFDSRWPERLRRYSKSRARAESKKITASAHSAPFLVAPNDNTSTPALQVISAGVQPR